MPSSLLKVLVPAVVLIAGCGSGIKDPHPEAAAHRDRGEGSPGGQIDLSLPFIENRGQVDPSVRYYLESGSSSVGFAPSRVRMALGERTAVDLEFPGARTVAPVAGTQTETLVSYFRGPRSEWETGVATFDLVAYPELWPGIDLRYSRSPRALKYELRVAPGADPAEIVMAYRGAKGLHVDGRGFLEIETPSGVIVDHAPIAWQYTSGRRQPVDVTFSVEGDSYGFRVGDYDSRRPLVIDPAIAYSGFIGGLDDDGAWDVAVDPSGNAYVVGTARSSDATFPVKAGPDMTDNGSGDAFVAKVNPSGTGLVYAGFIGGTDEDVAFGVAADNAGNAYVSGRSDSDDGSFPVAGGPETSNDGAGDAFVAKVNPAGTGLLYSGFIGGTSSDYGFGIAVDGQGHAYINGATQSSQTSFPVTVGPDLQHNGEWDVFAAKVNPQGTGLVYAGYIGGSGNEITEGIARIAVDAAGNAYLVGPTDSDQSTFPEVGGPDLTYNGAGDGFVAKVNPQGTSLVYAGYLGGTAFDAALGIVVDGSGRAHVGGITSSSQATFPVAVGPDLSFNGESDAFVARVSPAGTFFEYAGYIGGADLDYGTDLAMDPAGNAYLTGFSYSTESTFPVLEGPDLTANGMNDAFVSKVEAAGTGLVYSGFLGGTESELGWGLAVDPGGNAYLAGATSSTEASFPVVAGPDASYNGSGDAYITKVETTDRCGGRPATVLGSQGKDQLKGTPGPDVVLSLGGNDRVSVGGGKDRVCAGKKNDTVKGGGGADRLLGQQGKDDLIGGGGRDLCKGGPGKDDGKACEKGKV